MSYLIRAYRSKEPIRRRGCLVAQTASPIAGFGADVRLHDWAAELIAVDSGAGDEGGMAVTEVSSADLDTLERLIDGWLRQRLISKADAARLRGDSEFLDSARSAIAEGDHVYCVAAAGAVKL